LCRDVLADSDDHIRAPVLQELGSNTRFGFAEAVTEEPRAVGFLLPDRHTDVASPKPIPCVAEVHRLARWVGAKTVVREPNSPKSDLCQHRFDRLELNR
jgi:hypothetical protein